MPPHPRYLGLHRRGDAARARCRLPRHRRDPARRRPRARPRLHRPPAQSRAAARRRCSSAPPPCARIVEQLLPGVNIVTRPRLSHAHLCRREEDHPPAAPLGDRRLLRRRGLRHRRADPPPARRRGRRARRAQPAHAQRPGRALPVRRRRLPGRHRRHRHGPEPRRRPRRLRRRPQIRRLPVSPADRRPSSARSPAAPAATCATAPSASPAGSTPFDDALVEALEIASLRSR